MDNDLEFQAAARFLIRRRVGSGAMGVVYEAEDTSTGGTVALKTFRDPDRGSIYDLKQEFRSLADVSHPNLVSLYELVADEGTWFFTMELVRGVNFVEYLNGPRPPDDDGSSSMTPTEETTYFGPTGSDAAFGSMIPVSDRPQTARVPAPAFGPASMARTPAEIDRLVSVTRQLAEGLAALHTAGKLHRDLKPSNVLVTPEGRVVILDFGLAIEAKSWETARTAVIAGTPAYMSPEQAAGRAATPASDWYSVGVMVWEALTGRVPFKGAAVDVLWQKQHIDRPQLSSLVDGVPPAFEALVMALLDRDPGQRPSGADVLRALSSSAPETRAASSQDSSGPVAVTLVGRQKELAALDEAFAAHWRGEAVVLFVHGQSGIGKTSLVSHFLQTLRFREEAVILEGRCYEQESIPYKAFDGVIDSLTRYLKSQSASKVEALLPRDVLSVAKLFPVLQRVEAIENAPRRGQESPDPRELRRRGFAALKELLARLADRHPLVISIDDFQWVDADSAALMGEILRAPGAPPMMLVASFPTTEIESKPLLAEVMHSVDPAISRTLVVDALPPADARTLVSQWLDPAVPNGGQVAETVLLEAEGNPFLLEQLARYAGVSRKHPRGFEPSQSATEVGLVEMLEAQIEALPPEAEPVLEVLAVAGQALLPQIAFRAAGYEGDQPTLVSALRSAHLLRRGGVAGRMDLYHDRIRRTLLGRLTAEAIRNHHRQLAAAFEAEGGDPEALFVHYLGAGDQAQATRYAILAARKSTEVLAFDRAAGFLRRALELPQEPAAAMALKVDLAAALANAGRPGEAGSLYLEVSETAGPQEQLTLQTLAAEQLLIGGYIDRGLGVIRTVLAAIGMRLPESRGRALAMLLLGRARLALRGVGFTTRQSAQISATDRRRLDACWAVIAGLALVDPLSAAAFQTAHLLLALRMGDPYRVVRALAVEVGFVATAGRTAERRAAELSRRAEALAQTVDNPHALGLVTMTSGIAEFLVGRWRTAAIRSAEAEDILLTRCTGVTWELTNARAFLLGSLLYMGELKQIARRIPALMASAHDQGNLYAATEIQTRFNLMSLVGDDPEQARTDIRTALTHWTHYGFHRQHYNALLGLAQTDLYTGAPDAAWQRITEAWPALSRSLLLRIQVLRVEAHYLRARCALAMAVRRSDNAAQLREVERNIQRLTRERMAWVDSFAHVLRGALAAVRGEPDAARQHTASALDGFERTDTWLYAAATRRALGLITPNAQGQTLVKQADEWMRAQGVRNPARLSDMLVPGFSPPAAAGGKG